ncbi:MAG: four helix bundle protein [Thermomicrobiales bacterium]
MPDESQKNARALPRNQVLIALPRSMELVAAVYRETKCWPRDEQYGLISQIRRAAVAIPSNLAEGHGRSGPREFAHHTSIAYGSLCEVETQLLIAQELGYVGKEAMPQIFDLIADVRRLCRGLLRTLNDRSVSPSPPSPPSPPEAKPTPPERSDAP